MISITIPTYNRAHLLSRAIKSIINQKFEDWELIVVDDGSTDNTESVVQPFLQDSRIKYVQKENTGAAHSRNIGVNHSKEEYISFLDSDDEAKPEWLAVVMEEIEKTNPDLVCCGCEMIDQEGKLLEIHLPKPKKNLFTDVHYKMTNGGVFFIKRKIFLELGGYDKDLESGQHSELSFRLIPHILKNSGKIQNIYSSLIKIHIHTGERIRTNPKAKYLGSKRTLEKHEQFFSQRLHSKSQYAAITAHNASILGKKEEAAKYSLISFKAKPSFKGFLRILKNQISS